MIRMRQVEQGPQRGLGRSLVGPHRLFQHEHVDRLPVERHSGRRDVRVKVTDSDHIHTVRPLVRRYQCRRAILRSAAVRDEPVIPQRGQQLPHRIRQLVLADDGSRSGRAARRRESSRAEWPERSRPGPAPCQSWRPAHDSHRRVGGFPGSDPLAHEHMVFTRVEQPLGDRQVEGLDVGRGLVSHRSGRGPTSRTSRHKPRMVSPGSRTPNRATPCG